MYVINSILQELKLDEYEEPVGEGETELEPILKVLLDYACEKGIIEDSIVYRDILDTKLMGLMTPYPREVIRKFQEMKAESAEKATDWWIWQKRFWVHGEATQTKKRLSLRKQTANLITPLHLLPVCVMANLNWIWC